MMELIQANEINIQEESVNRKLNPIILLNLISDRHMSKILMSTYNIPKTIQNISSKNEIPIAVCYRKVRQLERLGLIMCVGKKPRKNGKGNKLYQSQIANAHFFLEKGSFRARIQLASGNVDDFGGSWSLRNEQNNLSNDNRSV
jgi:hypothetical protein